MTVNQGITFTIIAATMALFIWGRWRYDVVAVAALVVAVLAGVAPAGIGLGRRKA